MVPPANANEVQAFWNWFLKHEKKFFDYQHTDQNAEQIMDLVHKALLKVDENFSFEFGPPAPEREFVISAGGIKESFPSVLALQKAQPILERWAVTYFRPRGNPISTIAMNGLTINSRDIDFSILSRDTDIGLEIFIPGYDDRGSRYKQIGYLFLDQALGEFDVEMKVFYLRFFATSDPVKYERIPFEELPQRFDELYDYLKGLNGKPS